MKITFYVAFGLAGLALAVAATSRSMRRALLQRAAVPPKARNSRLRRASLLSRRYHNPGALLRGARIDAGVRPFRSVRAGDCGPCAQSTREPAMTAPRQAMERASFRNCSAMWTRPDAITFRAPIRPCRRPSPRAAPELRSPRLILILYVIFWAFGVWSGTATGSATDAAFRLFRAFVIYTLATSWNDFVTFATPL